MSLRLSVLFLFFFSFFLFIIIYSYYCIYLRYFSCCALKWLSGWHGLPFLMLRKRTKTLKRALIGIQINVDNSIFRKSIKWWQREIDMSSSYLMIGWNFSACTTRIDPWQLFWYSYLSEIHTRRWNTTN